MQGAAHLTIGMASAMAVIKPDSLPAALPVIAGAAAGCLICDIDCDAPGEKKNTSRWRIAALLIAAAAMILYFMLSREMQPERTGLLWPDYTGAADHRMTGMSGIIEGTMAAVTEAFQGGLNDVISGSISGWQPYIGCAGICVFVLTCAFASVSSHRGFSHSLLALALETASLYVIFPAVSAPFAIAFESHLLLDLTNRKPVRLFYPVKKGYALHWFYADRLANWLCAAAGTIWLAAEVLVLLR